MPAFEYQALDETGRKVRGVITADTEQAARRDLRRKSLAPLAVGRADERKAGSGDAASGGGESLLDRLRAKNLSPRELMLVTRQLATLIEAGLPVAEAISLVGGQHDKHHVRRALLSVRARVMEGGRLSEALTAFPGSFPPVYRALVSAGEGSGALGRVLERLSDYLEKAQAIRNRITGALIYPAVLTVVALLVVTLMMTVVVPRIAEQFTGMGMALPLLTRIMIALSEFMQIWALPLVGILFAGGVVLGLMLQRPAVKKPFDGFVLRVPMIGGFMRTTEAARFARTMGILLDSGAVLPEALRAAQRAMSNMALASRVSEIIRDVETGRALSDAMKTSKIFPALMLHMVTAGERSGALADMFERSADQLEQEIDGSVTVGLSLLQPMIILGLGIIVVLIVLSIMLPILQLNTMFLG